MEIGGGLRSTRKSRARAQHVPESPTLLLSTYPCFVRDSLEGGTRDALALRKSFTTQGTRFSRGATRIRVFADARCNARPTPLSHSKLQLRRPRVYTGHIKHTTGEAGGRERARGRELNLRTVRGVPRALSK